MLSFRLGDTGGVAGPLTCPPCQLGAGFSLPKPSPTPSWGFHALCETLDPARCSPDVIQPCSEVQNHLVTLLQRLLSAPGSGFILPVRLQDGAAGAPSQRRGGWKVRGVCSDPAGSCSNGLGRDGVVWQPKGSELAPGCGITRVMGLDWCPGGAPCWYCLAPSILSPPFLCHREVTLPLAPRSRSTLGAGGRMDALAHGEVRSSPACSNPNRWIYTGKFFIFDFFKRCMTSIG